MNHLPTGAAVSAEPSRREQILGLPRRRLARRLTPWIDRSFRVDQVYQAVYRRGVTDFDRMTDLGVELRSGLARRFRIDLPAVELRHRSRDGTCKYLLRLEDGASIEAVDIPDGRRSTLCLSSQAGCALGCRFCVTGYWGAGRNLTAAEIVGQVLAIRQRLPWGEPAPNIVFMGMGEPLQNLAALADALEIFTETVSWRRVTISTAGVVPGIEELAAWPQRPNLAISVHAPDDTRRSQLMPINRTYPLPELFETLRRYPLERGRKLTIEYLLVRGFNDALADADALSRLLRGLRVKVNLIPINPDPVLGEQMVPPPPAAVVAFRDRLAAVGLVATVRRRRGDDVAAACGQLRAPDRPPRGFRRSNLSF